jgi:hypothetical protein
LSTLGAFGCGSGGITGCCCASAIDLPSIIEKIAKESKRIDEITPTIFSLEIFFLDIVMFVIVFLSVTFI